MNYIVSNLQEMWDKNAEEAFLADPYLFYNGQSSGVFSRFKSVFIAEHSIKTKNDFYEATKDTDYYRDKFLSLLIPHLNTFNSTELDHKFWETLLSVGMDRYVTLVYDFFQKTERNYDPETHISYILEKEQFRYPSSFDDQRDFLQHDDLGQEQLFSIYIRVFYPEKIREKKLSLLPLESKKLDVPRLKSFFNKLININNLPLKITKYVLQLAFSFCNKKVLLQRVLFSDKNTIRLLVKSFGKISADSREIKFPKETRSEALDINYRTQLVNVLKTLKEPEKFELFFFETIFSMFPRLFVENFAQTFTAINKWALPHKNINYVVSETWPSDSIDALKIATLRNLYGTKHIYNEHNCIEHCYIGSLVHKTSKLADYFISLGWNDKDIKNLEPGGSLFDFNRRSYDFNSVKRHKICFVAGALLARMPQYSSSYSFASYGALASINVTDKFFSNLSSKVIGNTYFRSYPIERLSGVAKYNYEDVIQNKFKFKYFDSSNVDSKEIMLTSEIVVINYISTTHLETLSMNIPTIILIDKNSYHMSDSYSSFLDELKMAGILQTCPDEAAIFLESIYDSINSWWLKEEVQLARRKFLSKNFGKPEEMERKLLTLSNH